MNAAHPDAATVTPELEASYTAIIDDLLANCDLETVSIRRIRKDLEARTGKDLSELKVFFARKYIAAIHLLINSRTRSLNSLASASTLPRSPSRFPYKKFPHHRRFKRSILKSKPKAQHARHQPQSHQRRKRPRNQE